MSDHTGKIARWIEEVRPQCPDESVRSYHRRIASWIIAGLTEQGIPIDKLLSGEMVAQKPQMMLTIPEMVREIERLQACISDIQRGNLEQFKGHMRTMQEINEAALDYAGNPPVEPAGATHSEKWPATWPLDRD